MADKMDATIIRTGVNVASMAPVPNRCARRALLEHLWPGNVRELKNVVERAVYRLEDAGRPVEGFQFDPFDSPWRPGSAARQAAGASGLPDPRLEGFELKDELRQLEVRSIQRALEACGGNQRRAARRLGLSYHQFRGLLRKYELV